MAEKLTFYQRYVLLVLSTRGASAVGDWSAWYPMDTAQVRGVMRRLADRRLVDVAGFDGMARTWKLSLQGEAAVDEFVVTDDELANTDAS